MTILLTIIIYGGMLGYILWRLRPERPTLEKKVRREELELQIHGFQKIEGGYYILKNGETGIYTRSEALQVMRAKTNSRIANNANSNSRTS